MFNNQVTATDIELEAKALYQDTLNYEPNYDAINWEYLSESRKDYFLYLAEESFKRRWIWFEWMISIARGCGIAENIVE